MTLVTLSGAAKHPVSKVFLPVKRIATTVCDDVLCLCTYEEDTHDVSEQFALSLGDFLSDGEDVHIRFARLFVQHSLRST